MDHGPSEGRDAQRHLQGGARPFEVVEIEAAIRDRVQIEVPVDRHEPTLERGQDASLDEALPRHPGMRMVQPEDASKPEESPGGATAEIGEGQDVRVGIRLEVRGERRRVGGAEPSPVTSSSSPSRPEGSRVPGDRGAPPEEAAPIQASEHIRVPIGELVAPLEAMESEL